MIQTVLLFPAAFLATVILTYCASGFSQQPVEITLDPKTTYQTMIGWEATGVGPNVDPDDPTSAQSFDLYRDTLFDQAISDLGINRVRIEIVRAGPNGTGNGFDIAGFDSYLSRVVIPYKNAIEAKGEKLFINVCVVGSYSTDPNGYGQAVLAVYQHMLAKYGVIPDRWEVALEPDNFGWGSSTNVANAMLAAGNILKANSFPTAFIAPSNVGMDGAIRYFEQMIQVPGIQKYLSEFSYHPYSNASDQARQEIARLAMQYGKTTAMLEHIGADYKELHQDLKLGMNSAWQQYTLAYPEEDNGAQYYWIDRTNPTNPKVNIGRRTKFLRQYFKYVRRGAVRIKATSSHSSYDPLAFVNTDGRFVTVIKAETGGVFVIHGLPAGTYGAKYTTDSQYNIDAADLTISKGQSLNASIPTGGVITVYAKTQGLPSSVDAASYERTTAPGQIVSAFGNGMPPGTNIFLSAGTIPLPTTLGSISIRINETPVPLFFAGTGGNFGDGNFQINYQLPYEIEPGLASIKVVHNDIPVSSGHINIGAAAPGVFTRSSTGKGQAAALNQDLTMNGNPDENPGTRPETRGRVLILFANGPGGQFVNQVTGQPVTPVSGAAVPFSPLYLTASLPLVTVGNVPATVLYSGLTPGFVGLWQINLVIPPNAPTGNAVPLGVWIDGGVANVTNVAIN